MDIKAIVLEVPTPDFRERFHLPVACPIEARRTDEEQLINLDDAIGLTQKISHLVRFAEEFRSFDPQLCARSPGIGQAIPGKIHGQRDVGPDITTMPGEGGFDGMAVRWCSKKHKVSQLNEYHRWQCETPCKTFERYRPSFDEIQQSVSLQRYFP